MSFQVFPEGCDRGIVSNVERERVLKNWGIVTSWKSVRLICVLCNQRWGYEGT